MTRYQLRVPPGYMDVNKEDFRRFGDLVLWCQLLDKAKRFQAPVVFVTADNKEDWWEKGDQNNKIGPRRELVREMRTEADQDIYLYGLDRFLARAEEVLKVETGEAVAEVQAASAAAQTAAETAALVVAEAALGSEATGGQTLALRLLQRGSDVSAAARQIEDLQRQIEAGGVARQLTELQRQFEAGGVARQLTELQGQIEAGGVARQLTELQGQIEAGGVARQLTELQRQFEAGGVARQLTELQRQIEASGLGRQLADLQRLYGKLGS